MRKIILVAAMVLASASAHAGDRSLSLGQVNAQVNAPAPQATTTSTAATTQTSEVVPAVEAPKYIERPSAVSAPAPAAASTPAATTTASAPAVTSKPATKTARANKPRHNHEWTERRIISELHRYGIYW